MGTCKGKNKDGTDCGNIVKVGQDYCWRHQDQAPDAGQGGEERWTRERLEALVASHKGSKNLDLSGINCNWGLDFSGITLDDSILQGAYLGASNLQRASLRWTKLQRAVLSYANLQGADLAYARLNGAKLRHADLRGVHLGNADLTGADLSDADLRGSRLYGVDFFNANLVGANLEEVDLRSVKSLEGVRLYTAKLNRTLLEREQLEPFIAEEEASEHLRAQSTYLALKLNFKDIGDYDAVSWAYIKERQMERATHSPLNSRSYYGESKLGDHYTRFGRHKGKHGYYLTTATTWKVSWFYMRHTTKFLTNWIVELICGYGERPWRTVATMFVVFAIFMLIYWLTGAVVKVDHILSIEESVSGTLIAQLVTTREVTRNIADLAVFGLGAFTTMEPSGLEPRSTWVQLVSGFEALLGVGLTGLLGFVIGNRIRRS